MAVYDSFYGFVAPPFSLNPDPRFLFLSQQHREALAGLMYAVSDAKGFAVLTGEVGTGKTTLVHTLLSEFGDRAKSAFVFNPGMSRRDLYRYLLAEFRLEAQPSIVGATRTLREFLLEQFRDGRRVVVVMDEAHALSVELLEEVRLLCNFETSQAKLLQVLLVGQPELAERLAQSALRQLRQRVAVRLELKPFTFCETIDYVSSRLQTAGRTDELFTEGGLASLYRFSGGSPRLINVLCDTALLSGFAHDQERIDSGTIRRAARSLMLPPLGRAGIRQRLLARYRQRTESPALAAVTQMGLRQVGTVK